MLDACEIEGKCIHYPPDKWKGLWARAMKEKRSMYTNQAPPVPPGHPVIHNNLATPILFHGDVIGLLNIANKDGGYTDADRDTLDRLANRIAPVLYAWIQRKLREDERDAARAEIQRIADQRQLALDAAKLGWWQFDPNTCGAQWDEGYKAIFGVSGYARPNDEILKQIVHPEDLPVLWAEIAAALNPENPQPYATEYRINRPDGQVRWVEDHGIATFEGDGANRRAVNFVGTVQDITKRKLAEETLRESEELLRASLFEKEVLLKEIHHRVKNNMQVISSLVDLQANEVQDPAVCIIFQDVVHRVRSMAMVHEKLYQSSDLARVEFADYTETLLGYLWRSQGDDSASGIRLDLDLKPVYLPVNQAVPCGLILNELVNNTLKHAFRGKSAGRVTVRLGEDGAGRVQLEVRDDGVGLPNGLDWRRAPSLGLRLVQMLARQLKATVEAIGEEGAVFTITFDKSGS
jgi:PAS domain S-box-containing protein